MEKIKAGQLFKLAKQPIEAIEAEIEKGSPIVDLLRQQLEGRAIACREFGRQEALALKAHGTWRSCVQVLQERTASEAAKSVVRHRAAKLSEQKGLLSLEDIFQISEATLAFSRQVLIATPGHYNQLLTEFSLDTEL